MADSSNIIEVGDIVEVIDTFVVDLISVETGLHFYTDVHGVFATVTRVEDIQQIHTVHGIIHLKFISSNVAGYEATIPASFLKIVEKADVHPIDTLVVGSHIQFEEDLFINGIYLKTKGATAIVKEIFSRQMVVQFDDPIGNVVGGVMTEIRKDKVKILADWDDTLPEDTQNDENLSPALED